MGRGWISLVALTAIAAPAWAQDYTVTTASGRVEPRPVGGTATILDISTEAGSPDSSVVELPFTFPYYCKPCRTLAVSAHGWLVPGAATPFGQASDPAQPHGQDATSGAFPYGQSAANAADGVVAVLWSRLFSSAPLGAVSYWTSGSAPNRHFVVSWDQVSVASATNPAITIQCHLYETSGRIVFAYSSTASATYGGANYVLGLDSPIDLRFTAPLTSGRSNAGAPGADFVFDPVEVTFYGSVFFDKVVSNALGFGNSVLVDAPLDHVNVELRRIDDDYVYAAGAIREDGTFSVTGLALPAASPGTVDVVARNAGCRVGTSVGGPPTSVNLIGFVSFAAGGGVGTYFVRSDVSENVRAAFNVARACGIAYSFASERTRDEIPQLEVVLDPSSSAATVYRNAAPPAAATARVASRAAANPDLWDDTSIVRMYARHVLAAITAPQTTATDDRLDAVSDPQNAFAEAFGCFLWSAISGSKKVIDATSTNTSTTFDLETPTITVAKGEGVAACVAGALFDLLDPANEPFDRFDDPAAVAKVFDALGAVTVPATQSSFRRGWADVGHDAAAMARAFIGNGATPDDAFEANDSESELTSVGAIGFVRRSLVLTAHNEDWFSVTVPTDVPALAADANFDAAATGAVVAVEIRDAAGALLAESDVVGESGAVHALLSPAGPGTYHVGVRHRDGGDVPSYDLQVYVPPTMDEVPLRDWTLGQPYSFALGALDGILPYSFATTSGRLPPGLAVDVTSARVTGTPTETGAFEYELQMLDSGSPANVVVRTGTVTIRDVFRFPIAPFFGFPARHAVDTFLPTSGGTPPLVLSNEASELPEGLSFGPEPLHVTGTTTVPHSTPFELDGYDVAGSADHLRARAVVAQQYTGAQQPADLLGGEDACGWWFDAVQGSTVSFSVKTVKGLVKRTISGTVLAPDRRSVAGRLAARSGSLTGSKFVLPRSGRCYLIASAVDGDATVLLGTVVVVPPKAGKSKIRQFGAADTTSIEVGALPGARLTLKFAGDKKHGLAAGVVDVLDPTGASVAFSESVVAKGTGGTLTIDLPVGGTWTIVLGATSETGAPGKYSWSYAIKQPRGAIYSAE